MTITWRTTLRTLHLQRQKWLAVIVLLAILVPLAGAAARPAPAGAADPQPAAALSAAVLAKIEPQVLKELAENGTATYLVYLQATADTSLAQAQTDKLSQRRAVVSTLQSFAGRTQAPILAFLRQQEAAGHVKEMTAYWIFNGFAVTGDQATLLALAARADVERIQANHTMYLGETEVVDADGDAVGPDAIGGQDSPTVQSVPWNIAKIRADEVWNTLHVTGQGVVVANIDTGVYFQHPALLGSYRGYENGQLDHNYNWFDATRFYPYAPGDGHGHGTHTMGSLVGDDGGTNQIGVAPGARWVAAKAFRDDGSVEDVFIHAAFQWIMAPTDLNGQNPDPARAPDICSNSWGDYVDRSSTTFYQDVANLRAAHILTVFAAGNYGPGAATIDSPAGFDTTLAVGATSGNDYVASFSGRGPAAWGRLKPDAMAPGVAIRSAYPPALASSQYYYLSGTSMATPHAAGVAALLWQVRPDLSIAATEYVMTSTAVPLPTGGTSPNYDYGWGRLDAFQAVSALSSGGRLTGHVSDALSGEPVAGADITLGTAAVPAMVQTKTDAQGNFAVTISDGVYRMTVTNFWYAPQMIDGVELYPAQPTVRDVALYALPRGTISGHVASAGQPITATLSVAGTPVSVTTDALGAYTVSLPAGIYDLRLRPATGYMVGQAQGVPAPAGGASVRNFDLAAIPRLLLVDADAWSYNSRVSYYQNDLNALLLTYDLWTVSRLDTGLPPTDTLRLYDIVIWHEPVSSPGYIGAWSRLGDYLDGGGRLLISGQDIAYWDVWRGYGTDSYQRYLHSRFLHDVVPASSVRGVDGDVFTAITLTVNAADSAGQQASLDEVTPLDEQATPVLSYAPPTAGGGTAGLKVQSPAYRAVYLAFGLEGVGPAAARRQTLSQSLAWLASPGLQKTVEPAVAVPGQVLTYTLQMSRPLARGGGPVTVVDALPATLSYVGGSASGGLVYEPLQNRVTWQGTLTPAESVTLAFQAYVGAAVPTQTTVLNTAWLQDSMGRLLPSTARVLVDLPDLKLSSKTGQVALVGSAQVVTYTLVLANTGQVPAPVVVADPLPASMSYMPGSASGGAVYNAGLRRLEWSGVISPAGGLQTEYFYVTSDQASGPVFSWVNIVGTGTRLASPDLSVYGPLDIGFSFPFYGVERQQVYLSTKGWLSFSPSAPAQSANVCLPNTMARPLAIAPFWADLSPERSPYGIYYWTNRRDMLVISYVRVPRSGGGEEYTFQAILRADGSITFQYLDMPGLYSNLATIGVQSDDATRGLSVSCNAPFVHNRLAVRLLPPGPRAATMSFSFSARANDGLPFSTVITNTALAVSQGITYALTASNVINAVDLSTSSMSVNTPLVKPGAVLTCTLTVRNSGTISTTAIMTDVLPLQVTYVAGSASSGVSYSAAGSVLTWSGVLGPGSEAAVTFALRAEKAGLAVNSASIRDDAGTVITRSAPIYIMPYRAYFATIVAGYDAAGEGAHATGAK